MIENRWVFDDAYPTKILHRSRELEALSRLLGEARFGYEAENVLIHGPSGVGKTASARWLLSDLRQKMGLEWSLIECSGETANGIIYEAATRHSKGGVVHRNEPREQLLETLRAAMRGPYVLVLDEADVVPGLDVLEDLLAIGGLSVVAITHDNTEWLSRVDRDLQSRFHGESQIAYRKYDVGELVDILEPRVDEGLAGEPISDGQLEWIADETGGVARWAIKTVLAAAELAEERGNDQIHEADIGDGFERAKRKIREANLRSLPLPHLRLYELLRVRGPLGAGEMREVYQEHKEAICKGRRTVGWRQASNYLAKMADYDLVEMSGNTNSKEYRVIDPELEAPVEFDVGEAVEAD